jgi:hypothetical protein
MLRICLTAFPSWRRNNLQAESVMPANCGKCGRELPMVGGKAVPFWHECYKLLKGGRQITIDMATSKRNE